MSSVETPGLNDNREQVREGGAAAEEKTPTEGNEATGRHRASAETKLHEK